MRLILTLWALLVIADSALAQSQQPRAETPQVETEQKTNRLIQGKQHAQEKDQAADRTPTAIPKIAAEFNPENRDTGAMKSGEESTEYWPPFLGIRIKITDSLLALFTTLLVIFTGLLWAATRRIYRHSAVSERAYVKMSHRTRSGQGYEEGITIDRNSGEARIVIDVKNSGRTPADVTNVVLCWLILPEGQSPPVKPFYPASSTDDPTTAFLVADDNFLIWKTFDGITDDEFEEIMVTRNKILLIFGYADYNDVFGQRHRSGYARQYDPRSRGNNLIFMSQRGYNYDRRRKKSEGNNP